MSEQTDRNLAFMRQMGFADPAKFKHPVTILGAGSVGSAAGIGLGKMGIRQINLIDFDVFEEHNVSNQLCLEEKHLRMPKVEALGDLMLLMSPAGLKVNKFQRRLEGDQLIDLVGGGMISARPVFQGIVVNCPDDMKARKDVWNLCKFNPAVPYVIDVRMAKEYLKISVTSTMNMAQIARYEASLHTNEEASEDPCGMRAIIYTSMIAGALVAKLVKNLQLGESVPEEYDMDVHTGTVQQVIKGKTVASKEEHALAFTS